MNTKNTIEILNIFFLKLYTFSDDQINCLVVETFNPEQVNYVGQESGSSTLGRNNQNSQKQGLNQSEIGQ